MRRLLTFALTVMGLTAMNVLAAPCAGFNDVDTADSYCGAVTFVKNTGITLGCTATQYCPADAVTRAQMALFMQRLSSKAVFAQGGNAFGTTAVIGTNDAQALELKINGGRVLRHEWPNSVSPNVIGGHPANAVVSTGLLPGNTIAGGGKSGSTCYDPNADNFVTTCGNTAHGQFGVIGGGFANYVGGIYGLDTVGGGYGNYASGGYTVIGGGFGNVATGYQSAVLSGRRNHAIGDGATVVGGESNSASGAGSVVMGYKGITTSVASGSFVFADGTSSASPFGSGVANEFIVAASGGIRMLTNKNDSTGCSIAPGGGSWSCSSSRDVKRDFAAIDSQEVLAKALALPVMRWRYVNEPSEVRHMGTFSQDFRAAFGLGSDDTSITLMDAEGVQLAAIQGLNAKVEAQLRAKDARIAELEGRLARVEAMFAR